MIRSASISPVCFALLLTLLVLSVPAAAQDPARFEKDIRAFERADSAAGRQKGGNLFIGSSTFRRWDSLAVHFPGHRVVNRGFGGSHATDALHFVDRITAGHKPKQVLLYEGDNDIASGKPVDTVYADLVRLAEVLRHKFPRATLSFVAVKPSLTRWKWAPQIRALNSRLEAYARAHRRIRYIDVFNPMLDGDGKPVASLFVADGVHLTPEGYALWTRIIRPYLK